MARRRADDDYDDEDYDDREVRRRVRKPEGDATGGVIPYKNGPALASYYCGVFSLIPCVGIPLGITALVLGILGLKKRRENPQVRGAAHAWIGIILGGGCALANLIVILIFTIAIFASRH